MKELDKSIEKLESIVETCKKEDSCYLCSARVDCLKVNGAPSMLLDNLRKIKRGDI